MKRHEFTGLEETITAIKKNRAEIRDTPTWYAYNHSA